MAEYAGLYPFSANEAKRLNEMDRWRESHKANLACKRAIQDAVRKGFDGMHLAPGCAKEVIAEYGFKRVGLVLAATLKEKSYDGRFSRRNKEWFQKVPTPPDSKHNAELAVDSHPTVLDGFMDEYREAFQELGLFDAGHCMTSEECGSYVGKVVAVSVASLKEQYLTPQSQLWYAQSGFGCDPNSAGRAVYATCLGDGERARWDRSDIIGAVKEELLPDWAKGQVEQLRAGQKIGPIDSPATESPAEEISPGMTQKM